MPNVPKAREPFWTHQLELLGDVGHVESRSVCLEKLLLGDKAELEAHFRPFGDSANLDSRSVHGLR